MLVPGVTPEGPDCVLTCLNYLIFDSGDRVALTRTCASEIVGFSYSGGITTNIRCDVIVTGVCEVSDVSIDFDGHTSTSDELLSAQRHLDHPFLVLILRRISEVGKLTIDL
jgi:hypothetical protein